MEKKFSAFWALLIVLLTLGVLQVASLRATYQQRAQIQTNIDRLSQSNEDIKKVDDALGTVTKDLLALSATNPVAKQVVTEFQIRQNEPTASPTP